MSCSQNVQSHLRFVSRIARTRRKGSYMTGASPILSCLAAGLAVMSSAAGAQSTGAAPAPAMAADPMPVAEGFVRIPANTVVNFEIADALSSKTSKIDDMFAIRLHDPVVVDGKVVLPSGTLGQGQIVHAAKAKSLGKAGELILAARYLQCGDAHIALRGFRFSGSGEDDSGKLMMTIIAVGVLGYPVLFKNGGEITVPVGTFSTARLAKAVDIQMAPAPQCAGSGPLVVPVSTNGTMTVAGTAVGAVAGGVAGAVPAPTPMPVVVPASVSNEEGKSK